MEPTRRLRLLPWSSPEGRPAYTPDDPDSRLAALADRLEEEQLCTGRKVLEHAESMLDPAALVTADSARWVVRRVTECLSDALRVAESRGGRLRLLEQCLDDEEFGG